MLLIHAPWKLSHAVHPQCFSFGLELVCTPPSFFSAGSGRWIMLLLVLVIVFPLCFPKNLTAVRLNPPEFLAMTLPTRHLQIRPECWALFDH